MGEGGRKERRGKSPSFHNKASKKEGGKKIGKDKTHKTQEGREFWAPKSALGDQRLLGKAESYILSLVSFPQKGSKRWKQWAERDRTQSIPLRRYKLPWPQCSHFPHNYLGDNCTCLAQRSSQHELDDVSKSSKGGT